MRSVLNVLSVVVAAVSVPASAQQFSVPNESLVMGPIGERVDAYLEEAAVWGFSGVVLLAEQGEILLHKGYGLADYERGVPFTTQTAFDMGSITKSLTATAIMRAEADGLLSVHDPIGRFFDNVPTDKAKMTIHHLLTHSSGLQNSMGEDYDAIPRDSLVGLALASELRWEPGTRYRYSNAGYGLLAAILELTSGQAYEDYLREHIFEPAGMRTTGYVGVDWESVPIAHSYRRGVDEGTPFSGRMAIWDRQWSPEGPYWNLLGNGGLVTTAADLYRFVLAHDAGIIVPDRQQTKLDTPFVRENEEGSSHYGYGWTFFPDPAGGYRIAHDGSDGAFYSLVSRSVNRGRVLVFHANASGLSSMVGRIAALVYGQAVTKLPQAWRSSDEALLGGAAGVYELPGGDRLEVERQAGGLAVQASNQSGATMLVGAPIPPADDRLASFRSNAVNILDAMVDNDFEPYRAVYQSDGPEFSGEVDFWTGAFESWGERFDAYRGARLLGGRMLSGRLVAMVGLNYEKSTRFVGLELQDDGRYFIFFDGASWLSRRRRFVPTGPDVLEAYDFQLDSTCRMLIVRSDAGVVNALRVGCPTDDQGGVIARKLSSR